MWVTFSMNALIALTVNHLYASSCSSLSFLSPCSLDYCEWSVWMKYLHRSRLNTKSECDQCMRHRHLTFPPSLRQLIFHLRRLLRKIQCTRPMIQERLLFFFLSLSLDWQTVKIAVKEGQRDFSLLRWSFRPESSIVSFIIWPFTEADWWGQIYFAPPRLLLHCFSRMICLTDPSCSCPPDSLAR